MKRIERNIINKLKSNSGISILFALLLFMVVSMVSIVIITASNSAIKRIVSNRENIQNNIGLDSALNLLKDDISNATYTINSNIDLNGNESFLATSAKLENCTNFTQEINNISYNILNNKTTNTYTSLFNIEATNLNTVLVSYLVTTIDTKQVVYFKLIDTISNNSAYIIFNIEIDVTSSSSFGNTSKSYKLKWSFDSANGKGGSY